MTPNPGESKTPRFAVERAADAAMRAAEAALEEEGATLRKMLVLIYAENVPPGELDCTTSGTGYDDALELATEVFGHFAGTMRAMGLEIAFAPLGRG